MNLPKGSWKRKNLLLPRRRFDEFLENRHSCAAGNPEPARRLRQMDSYFQVLRFLAGSLWVFSALASPILPAHACTLWAVTDDRTADGAVLIAKNRDWTPQRQELELIKPEKGYCFFALLPIEPKKQPRVVAGINEKGLVVVSATAGSIPEAERKKGGGGLSTLLLNSRDSVDAVVETQEVFSRYRPGFYMFADRKKIGVIEIAPEGRYAFRVSDRGVLFHTNHYLDESLLRVNDRVRDSSRIRLNRIREILDGHSGPFHMDDFVGMSEDRHAGPDNSIWRTGSTLRRTRTLSAWIVALPKEGGPRLYVKLANPGEPEAVIRHIFDASFWR